MWWIDRLSELHIQNFRVIKDLKRVKIQTMLTGASHRTFAFRIGIFIHCVSYQEHVTIFMIIRPEWFSILWISSARKCLFTPIVYNRYTLQNKTAQFVCNILYSFWRSLTVCIKIIFHDLNEYNSTNMPDILKIPFDTLKRFWFYTENKWRNLQLSGGILFWDKL